MNYCQQCAQTVVMLNRGCGSVMVESIAANVSVVVRRQRAEFGSVTVFCFAQSVRNGASQNEDFIFQPRVQLACVSLQPRVELACVLGYSWPVYHFSLGYSWPVYHFHLSSSGTVGLCVILPVGSFLSHCSRRQCYAH